MKLEIQNGSLCIVDGGEVLVSDITAYLRHPGTHFDVITVPAEGAWTLEGNVARCDNITMESEACADGILLRATFKNLGEDITVPCDFTSFAGTLHRTPDRMIANRRLNRNGLGVCEMQSPIDTVHTVYGAVYESGENTVFDTVEGGSFAFGAASYEKYFPSVTVSRDGYITAFANTEQHPIKKGGSVTSEWFLLLPCDEPIGGLDKFARTVAARLGVKRSEKKNPFGFCSWYYYGMGISSDKMRRNMKVLTDHKDLLPVKYIQIDEGWNDRWGSWQVNEKFADMQALIEEIKANGYTPGIWLAPFGCHAESPLVTEHPDWFVKKPDGELWRSGTYMFDFTNPAVREYIGGVLRRLTFEWGFRYVKLDIITPNLAAGIHFDPDATALENYRLGLKTCRENVTEDTFLLGCTAPFGGAIGLVDGMRVSLDVFERWESIRRVFNATLKRYYYHRNYYLIDADCLLVRKAENEDDECFRLCTRNDDEIRTYVTAMAASGGILMLSDKLPLLSEEQLTLISKLYPLAEECALPLDLMDSYIPGVLDFGKKGATRTVALINWSDSPRRMSVENGEALVWEFWGKSFDVHAGGNYSLTIPPHGARVLYFTDRKETAVVGSDASVVMQSAWAETGGRVTGKRLKTGEKLFVASTKPLTANGSLTALATKDGYTVYEFIPAGEDYSLETK